MYTTCQVLSLIHIYVAWSDRVTVAIVVQPTSENFLTEIQEHYKVIGSMYRCLYDTFSAVTQFYVMFFYTYIYSLVMLYSMLLFYDTSDTNSSNIIFATIAGFVVDVLVLAMCQ